MIVMIVNANYTDGLTAKLNPIVVDITVNGLLLPLGQLWAYDELDLIASNKNDGRLLYRNKNIDGPIVTLLFEEGHNDPAREYLGRVSKKLTGDSNWKFVRWQIMTAVIIVGLMAGFYFAYPYFNRAIVSIIPNSWAVKAGDMVVDGLYQQYSSSVCHSEQGDQALQKLVKGLEVEGLGYPLRVEVVDNNQVNALTVAGGRIVIFNGLLEKASSSDEVAGVLAHEIGHVYYKHPLQGLVNILGFSIVGSFVGGDAASIAIIGLSLSYSRDLERLADQKALEILGQKNVSAIGLLEFFKREKKREKDNISGELESIFSTHPLNDERMKMLSNHVDQVGKNRHYSSILTIEDWSALRNICRTSEKMD